MEKEIERREFVFYHADRAGSLREGQAIELDENGLSRFGRIYWPGFHSKRREEMEPAEEREFLLEQVRKDPRYSLYASRLQSIFAANTIEEAIVFAESIVPRPTTAIPIIEIFANKFWTLDSSWLDYKNESNDLGNYFSYWDGRITNHSPSFGARRPPRLEVMIALPARAGKIVHVVE